MFLGADRGRGPDPELPMAAADNSVGAYQLAWAPGGLPDSGYIQIEPAMIMTL
jgi:hypothetical protein